jgi:NADH-quinone oxidoreductase subunit C
MGSVINDRVPIRFHQSPTSRKIMNPKLQKAIQTIQKKFGSELLAFRGEQTLMVTPKDIVPACQSLRDEHGFQLLGSLTATDYWPKEKPRFHLSYQFHNIEEKMSLRLRVPVPGSNPIVPTVEGIFPNANWHEREIFDMFGIRFEGHSDMRRILMPYDWEGHPLQKNYPLGYEEPQFTFNFDEIEAKKHYAKE